MSDSLDWEIVRNDDLTIRQKEVIKSVESQKEFLSYTIDEDTTQFCGFFRKIGIEGTRRHRSIPQMTESEFIDPPWSSECQIWETFKHLPPALAATPGSWTRICLQGVEEGHVRAASFARPANSSKDANGLARIKIALNNDDEKEIANCTSRIFRVMGGLLGARGYRSTYIDCPIARAWWRHRVALIAARTFGNNEDIQSYSRVLRIRRVWEPLMEHIVSKQTIIGFPTVISAVVKEALQLTNENGNISEQTMVRLLVQAGGSCANQALELLKVDEIVELIFGRHKD